MLTSEKEKIGIGLDSFNSNSSSMSVVLYELNNKYPLGTEVGKAELEAWKQSNLLVSLNFHSVEAIKNFINVLRDFVGESEKTN